MHKMGKRASVVASLWAIMNRLLQYFKSYLKVTITILKFNILKLKHIIFQLNIDKLKYYFGPTIDICFVIICSPVENTKRATDIFHVLNTWADQQNRYKLLLSKS